MIQACQITQRHTLIKSLIIFSAIALTSMANAASFDDCPENFYVDTPPEYISTKVPKQNVSLCFNGFATLYSGLSRTPIWSAEHLTLERLTQADTIPRDDSFHSEKSLPDHMQASLSDYKSSGYDRGHLAPNADMATIDQQYDSFSLANIIPQAPRNNRYVWRNLESVTRYLTEYYGETYVVSGVAFEGKKILSIGDNDVLVPTHVFKAVYIPAIGESGVYYAPNDDEERVEIMSVDDLAMRINIDVFPTIDSSSKANPYPLPLKVSDIDELEAPPDSTEDPWWLALLVAIVDWVVDALSKS